MSQDPVETKKKNKRGKRAEHRVNDREERGQFRREKRKNDEEIDKLYESIRVKMKDGGRVAGHAAPASGNGCEHPEALGAKSIAQSEAAGQGRRGEQPSAASGGGSSAVGTSG